MNLACGMLKFHYAELPSRKQKTTLVHKNCHFVKIIAIRSDLYIRKKNCKYTTTELLVSQKSLRRNAGKIV